MVLGGGALFTRVPEWEVAEATKAEKRRGRSKAQAGRQEEKRGAAGRSASTRGVYSFCCEWRVHVRGMCAAWHSATTGQCESDERGGLERKKREKEDAAVESTRRMALAQAGPRVSARAGAQAIARRTDGQEKRDRRSWRGAGAHKDAAHTKARPL